MNPKLIAALNKFAHLQATGLTTDMRELLGDHKLAVTGFVFRPAVGDETENGANYAAEVHFCASGHDWMDPSSATTTFKMGADDYHRAAELFIERIDNLEAEAREMIDEEG